MLKRLLVGLAKGGVVGIVVGAVFHYGLGLRSTPGLLGHLIAMGTGASAGVFAGRPPWRHEAWIEAVLKALVGLGLGALLFWLAARYLTAALPVDLPFAEAGDPWNTIPLLYAPVVGSLYGAFVELDNTRPAREPGPPVERAPQRFPKHPTDRG